jgi:hypothetical protein
VQELRRHGEEPRRRRPERTSHSEPEATMTSSCTLQVQIDRAAHCNCLPIVQLVNSP